MNILPVLLFAVSASLDSLVIGISYGIKKIHISLAAYTLVTLITFVCTILSLIIGKSAACFATDTVSSVIGSMVLIIIGVIGLINYIRSRMKVNATNDIPYPVEHPEKYDRNNNKRIERSEAVFLGFALSANNIGLGIGAGIAGLSVLPVALMSLVFGVVFLFAGNVLGGRCLSGIWGKHAELIASVIIIALGIWEMLF